MGLRNKSTGKLSVLVIFLSLKLSESGNFRETDDLAVNVYERNHEAETPLCKCLNEHYGRASSHMPLIEGHSTDAW